MAIPASGKLSEERQALEQTRTWKRGGYRWRAGIEGRIASLRRDFGWRKSRYYGQDGMERWLGLGVIASNLHRIALAWARKTPSVTKAHSFFKPACFKSSSQEVASHFAPTTSTSC